MKKTIVCILTACMILSPWATFAQAADQAEVSKAESVTAEEQVEAAKEALSQGNYEKAMECYQAAADAGSVDALVGIGDLYYYGAGVELSFEKANEYYRMAADQGSARGQMYLGYAYLKGKGTEQDVEKGLAYCEKAADQGLADAQCRLGDLYFEGEYVEQSDEKAYEYYRLAADQGDKDALMMLGCFYLEGRVVEQSYEKAREYFERAAEKGSGAAFNNLGVLYDNGFGVEASSEKAVEYYQKAAETDNPDAFFNLGMMVYFGRGVEQSYEKAFEYFRKSADLGSVNGQIMAAYMYREGQGVEQSYEKAMEYLQLAGEQGNSQAVNDIGDMYENGQGVEQSYEKAEEYYRQAISMGSEYGLYSLGTLYEFGHGVEQSYEKAAEYYQQAADAGLQEAADALERLKADGLVPEDSKGEPKVYEQNGFTLTYTEEFQKDKLKGVMMEDPRGMIDDGIFYASFFYYTMPEDELDALMAKDMDEITEADLALFRSSQGVLGIVYGIDRTKLSDENAAVLESVMDQMTEIGRAGNVVFYRQNVENTEETQTFLENIAPAYQEEYRTLRAAFNDVLKNAEFFVPVIPGEERVGTVIHFEATDLDGNPVTSEEIFRDHEVTMVNLWATWCINCINEMTELGEMAERLAAKNVALVGICTDAEDNPEGCREILKQHNVTYLNLKGVENLEELLGWDGALPTSYFFGSDGTLLCRAFRGAPRTMEPYEKVISGLLGEA